MSLTLLGTHIAETGAEFVYRGEAAGCEGCPYRKQCLTLDSGTRYAVTDVREGGEILDCAVHEEGVVAVDVETTAVEANVPSKAAYAGSRVSLAGTCPHTECPSHPLCEPLGADMDTEYRIVEILGDPPHDVCHLNRSLTRVKLAPANR
ncbi:hypothetical protein HTSR_0661 [Halodesulfurarchaeum formicicum]|uniref:UPF0179 protein HSR6_0687 n=1 Tax=Halodesulfurarchaeum formicicum TaxID=1873524 RepID=A0A1D8S3C5_9EURY|nr:UPF0179 family protein [Halodesulfurarchaeum formicicum]AOW79854.1 hypothetical protein HTSR_0661 [Halodesulfurarchaeum formicicum]APE95147.1 hypothetical protein HSR6_0687 [Halodesulfurarchaeum formicicum]